ncbi:discoidin domain-containing protein [Paenibacillus tyrfis]|uniref:discoidin domain-containing protein n=1 Tax=Paenibacillus tyrfis TaxID=1501230 RepID=UPI0039B7957B
MTATAVSSSQVNLSWTASTDNVGVKEYKIYRGSTEVGTATGTSYSDTGLNPSTTYSYTVKAFDAAGNASANSNTASATTSDGPSTDTNIAKGKTAKASSVEGSGYEASKAFDGNASTRWASKEGSDSEWIYVDLGKTYSIHKVKLNWEAAYGKNYKIQVSNDSDSPANWTDVYTKTNGKGGVEEINFAAQDARYVRMYGTARGTSYGYSLYEFEVYGSSGN